MKPTRLTFNTATSALSFSLENFNAIPLGVKGNPEDFGPFSVSSPIFVEVFANPNSCLAGNCLDAGFSKDLTITFDTAVNAVSFYLGDILTAGGGSILFSIDGAPEVAALTLPDQPNATDTFFGIYDLGSSFTSIKIRTTDDGDIVGLDDLAWATGSTPTAVAEPGTMALFGLGLAGLGYARRRKTAK